jgi:hypothetical protein
LITPLLLRPEWLAELGVTEDGYWQAIGALGNFTFVPRGRRPTPASSARELLRMTRMVWSWSRTSPDPAVTS